MDNRAQPMTISRFFLGLLVGAIVTWGVYLVTEPLLTRARETTSNASANQATTWLQTGTQWFPIFVLIVSFFGIVVGAIYAREVLGS
jgi:ABC-type antimicrobial peptide transport system permease subunit